MNYFNYFSEIEEVFIRRRGRNLLLSPLDWALIESWQEREVPLHIILRGIEKIFDHSDQQTGRKRPISSLLYCKAEIEAQFADWLDSQVGNSRQPSAVSGQPSAVSGQQSAVSGQQPAVGSQPPEAERTAAENHSSKSDLFPDEVIAAHLERVSGEVEAAMNKTGGDWRAALESVLNRLTQLRQKPQTAENLEAALEKLDAFVDENLLRNFEIETLKPEIEKQIASYKNKMEADVYRRTFDLMLLKRLREQALIPRLSLFYL